MRIANTQELSRTTRPALQEDGRIVVVTDGGRSADPAFLAAAFIAGRIGAEVLVLSVIEPVKNHEVVVEGAARRTQQDHAGDLRHSVVEAQLALTVGAAAAWPISIAYGILGPCVKRFVAQHEVQLVLVGHATDTPDWPVAERQGALRIIERSDVPVYVATTALRHIPRSIVIGTDFSPASVLAIQVVARFCAVDAILYLVHVMQQAPRDASAEVSAEIEQCRQALRTLETTVRDMFDLRIRSALVFGRPGVELIRFAAGVPADLIACGGDLTHHSNIGRVAHHLLAHSECSVLFVPHTRSPLTEPL